MKTGSLFNFQLTREFVRPAIQCESEPMKAPLKEDFPLEDLYRHLLDFPFHDFLQKVKGEDSFETLLKFDIS
jgi:hypothetical protein